MVQRTRGPGYVLYERHGPQTPWPSHQILMRTPHSQCYWYSPINENAIHQRQWNPTVHQCDGSGAAKIQVGKTCHTGQVYARCGAKIATTAKWAQNRNAVVVENTWRPTNLDGVEGNLQGGICSEKTRRIRPRRRGKTLWWFRGNKWFSGKGDKWATKEARAYSVCGDRPADKSDAGLAWGLPGKYRCNSNTNCRKRSSTRGVSSQSCNISQHCRVTEKGDKSYVRTDKRYEKERDGGLQHRYNVRRRTGGDCMHTLQGGWPYRATQKECILLWPEKDDGPKGVGSKTDGREGSDVQRWWMRVGDSANSST